MFLILSVQLRLKHEPVQYFDIEAPSKPKSHVLFRSSFLNDTTSEQEYQLSAERKTVSSCSFEIFEGFVNENSLTIEIPLPNCALKAGAGFKREYTLENTRNKTVEEEMRWTVQSNIKVMNLRFENRKPTIFFFFTFS